MSEKSINTPYQDVNKPQKEYDKKKTQQPSPVDRVVQDTKKKANDTLNRNR